MLCNQLWAVAIAALGLAVTGCGESSKTGSSSTASTGSTPASAASQTSTGAPASATPLTQAELIAKGDAICAAANKKVDTVTVEAKGQILKAFPRAAVYERAEASELTKLTPPESMAHDWEQIVGGFNRYVVYANAAVHDSETKNVKALTALFVPAEKVHEQINAIAKRDGFKYCSGIV
jgi:hypothetical protein